MNYDEEQKQKKIELLIAADSAEPDTPAVAAQVKKASPATLSPYECEYLSLRIREALTNCQKSKRHSEADLLSRLLVDVNDGNVGGTEAERILTLMESRINRQFKDDEITLIARPVSKPSLGLIVASIALLALPIGYAVLNSAPKPSTTIGTAPLNVLPLQSWSYFRSAPNGVPSAMRSLNSNFSTDFTLSNTTNRHVTVYWRSFSGERKKYFDLQPGGVQSQQTYGTHPWEVVDDSGKTLLWFVAGRGLNEGIDLAKAMQSAR